jgi:hypothetical protein
MLSQNGDAVGESGRVNFVNHELLNQKPAEINTTPNPSTPETGGKVEANGVVGLPKIGATRGLYRCILQFRRATEQV